MGENKLAGKKQKFNQKKKKILFTTTIEVYDDNTAVCTGPIDNPVLMMQIFASGMNVVTSHNMSLEKVNADKMAEADKGAKPKLIL